jgi:phosphoribosylamine--glycine ligase
MRVLVVGSGGREHALCWSLAGSPLVDKLFCLPGNAGIAEQAQLIAADPMDFAALIGVCRDQAIDFVVVGPETPLCAGLVDALEAAGIKAFGPSAQAARLEGSKGFTKDFCQRFDIPTAAFKRCRSAKEAKSYLAQKGSPIVVKADGLAAGKGVTVAATEAEALAAIDQIFSGSFGEAGLEAVLEEMLVGEEASFFALCDGKTAIPFGTAQDHKRVGDQDTGPNTGGMGAYSPAPILTAALQEEIMTRIIRPTLGGMREEGWPFTGVLYAGLMLTQDGPKLIEYNVRFGDPETQVLMPRLKSDLLTALVAARDGVLDQFDVRWRDEAALTVVMAAKGYPGAYGKGSLIGDLAAAAALSDVTIFHAGTSRDRDGRLIANGGRVLNVTAMGPTVADAQAKAYAAVSRINWPGGFCRHDIGHRAVTAERRQG